MHIPSERNQFEKATHCLDSNYLTFWKRQNYTDNRKISGHQGWKLEERGMDE